VGFQDGELGPDPRGVDAEIPAALPAFGPDIDAGTATVRGHANGDVVSEPEPEFFCVASIVPAAASRARTVKFGIASAA
jgi:hypothetical protein